VFAQISLRVRLSRKLDAPLPHNVKHRFARAVFVFR
jgi:hypothetical protein